MTSMSKWCLLQLLVCVSLHISNSDAVCSGSDREVIYDYDNQKDFKIKIVKNPDNLDASLSLRGSPPPGELTMKSKKQRVFISSKSGTFTLQKIQFKVQGIIGASATFYRQEKVKSKTKVRKITKKWTIIKDSFGLQFPDSGMSDLEKMVLVFKLRAKATAVSVKDLVMHVCIKGKGDGGDGGLVDVSPESIKQNGLTKEAFKFVTEKVPVVQQLIAELVFGKKIDKPTATSFDDVMMTPEQIIEFEKRLKKIYGKKGKGRPKRKFIRSSRQVWPDAVVPYKIDIAFTKNATQLKVIKDGMAEWEKNTCLRFREAKNDEHFAKFVLAPDCAKDGSNSNDCQCKSYVGRVDKSTMLDGQHVHLRAGCVSKISAGLLHEIGHLIGFYHEQDRSDRDDFIRIVQSNIGDGQESIYVKEESLQFGVDYGYDSIMHYFPATGSKNGNAVMRTIDQALQNRMSAPRAGVTFLDAKLANIAYNCSDKCPKTLNCLRGGFINPNDCDSCLCPDGFGGKLCELAAPSIPGCSPSQQKSIAVTNTKQCLETPNYGKGNFKKSDTHCNWLLKAPSGSKVKLFFDDEQGFELRCLSESDIDYSVCFNWVEIRYKDLSKQGPSFCCEKAPTKTFVSESNEALVNFVNEFKSEAIGFRLCFMIDGAKQPKTTTTSGTTTLKQTPPTNPPVPDCAFYKDREAKCVAKCEGGAGCENVPGCEKGEICCFPVEKEYWPKGCVSEKLCRDFPGGECKEFCGEPDGFICGNLDCASSRKPKCCMTIKSKEPPRCGRQQIPFK